MWDDNSLTGLKINCREGGREEGVGWRDRGRNRGRGGGAGRTKERIRGEGKAEREGGTGRRRGIVRGWETERRALGRRE